MSEMSVSARKAMREKAERLTRSDRPGKIDASDYTAPELLHAEAKTGMRPVSRRQFKAGGAVEGKSETRADRKPRGIATELMNRDQKTANQDRDGVKHVGGMKKGGRATGGAAEDGTLRILQAAKNPGILAAAKKSVLGGLLGAKRGGSVSDGTLQGTRPTGGRLARKSGGRAGKMNVNVVINTAPKEEAVTDMPPPMPPPPGNPAMMAPKPMPMPPPPPVGAPPPMAPPPVMRKAGGRIYKSAKDMDAGAGGGLGRLEKIEIQEHQGRR